MRRSMAGLFLITLLLPLGLADGARGGVFRADKYAATVTTQKNVPNHVWHLGSLTFSCSGPQVDGQLLQASPSLTFSVQFLSCSVPIWGGSTTPDFSPCDFRAILGETIAGRGFQTYVELFCGSKWVNWKFLTCEIHVPTQKLSSAYAYAPTFTEEEQVLNLETEAFGLKYEVVVDGALCPYSSTGTFQNGSYSGRFRLFGEPLICSGWILIYGTDF